MDDRVYPSSKPINPPPQNGTTTGAPSFPPSKAQLYGATRPPYRPQPKPRHRHSRGCCCRCCLWTTLLVIVLILLVAIAGVVFWVLYRPHRPTFSVKSLKITQFNITTPKNSSPILNSKLDLTISARNPNNKIVFLYDPVFVSIKSNGVHIGDGSFPSFLHSKKNTTSIRALLSSDRQDLDSDSVKSLNSDLKNKNGLPLEIELDTKVRVKIGSMKTKKVRIKVSCKGIDVTVPKGKSSPSTMKPSKDAKCKVNLKIKIWKWTT